jgi:hypothetical protein
MLLKVENFKTLLKKASLNYQLKGISLNVSKNNINTKLEIPGEVFILLDMENNIISEMKGEYQLNFISPETNVIPFINLIDDEEASIEISKEQIELSAGRLNTKLIFDDISSIPILVKDVSKTPKFFITLDINDEFKYAFNKIKSLRSKLGKIYFTVKDKVFSIENTDRKNKHENTLNYDLCKTDVDDLSLCFDHSNFVNLMSVLSSDKNYKISFCSVKNGGVCYIYSENKDEQYWCMTKLDV